MHENVNQQKHCKEYLYIENIAHIISMQRTVFSEKDIVKEQNALGQRTRQQVMKDN